MRLLLLFVIVAGCVLDPEIIDTFIPPPLTGSVVSVVQDTGAINVHFCPQENCSQLFMDFLGMDNVHCALYELNKPEIIDFLNRDNAQIIVDEDSEEDVLGMSNVQIDHGGALMHNKFCISGNKLFTGSMNPTLNDMTKNNNNMVLIESEDIAAIYETEFQELWNKSRN